MSIDHSNLEDYADPAFYDAEHPDFEPDGPFYLALAKQIGGPVLELGCGTGRITTPLGQAGIDITGLDIVPEMLACAQHKAQQLSIQWVEGDLRTFQLGRQFSLICATGGAFQMLLTRPDHEAVLARVQEHLSLDGYFAIDVVAPQPDWLGGLTDEQEWNSYVDGQGRRVRVTGTDYYDPIRQIKHETIYRHWQSGDGQPVRQQVRFAFRYIFPQEMEALLHYNGFTIVDCYGDAQFNPPTRDSNTLYYVCQAMRKGQED